MPNVAEAAVPVAGVIASLEETKNFDTKAVDGVRALIATSDGFASIKIKSELLPSVQPKQGANIAWMVRYGANDGRKGAAVYISFLRPVNADDIDRLVSAAGIAGK